MEGNKTFKIRVEDTETGEVKETETGCFLLFYVGESSVDETCVKSVGELHGVSQSAAVLLSALRTIKEEHEKLRAYFAQEKHIGRVDA